MIDKDEMIDEVRTLIKDVESMSEDVTWFNAGEDMQSIGDKVDSFLILHAAKLRALIEE